MIMVAKAPRKQMGTSLCRPFARMCECVCVCGWVRMCTNRSDRDAICFVPAGKPCVCCDKRVEKESKQKSLFLPNDTQPHNISLIFLSLSLSLSAPWRLLWLLRDNISGLALALLMLLLAYTITVVCFSSVLSCQGGVRRGKVGIGSGRTNPGTPSALLRQDAAPDVGHISAFNHQSVYVCVWKCVPR